MPAHHAFPPRAGPLAGGLASQLVMAALAVLCATAVRGEPIEVAAAAASCPSSCLKCDAKGACTSCPARFGLNTAKRCVKCADGECLDCNANYKKCTLCAYGTSRYIDAKGSCQPCRSPLENGACFVNDTLGCNRDGSCQKCDELEGFVSIKGKCQTRPLGCNVTNTLPDGSCKTCNVGYTRLPTGKCKQCPDTCTSCRADGTCQSCWGGTALQGGKCVNCRVDDCDDCTGDLNRCRKCTDWVGGLDANGTCVSCADPKCADCGVDFKKCTACYTGYYLKGGKCTACGEECSYTAGCGPGGVCKECKLGYGRVGQKCVKCKVKSCNECNGDASKCQKCGLDADYNLSYPNKDRTRCLRCQVHPQCFACKGANGACIGCEVGWGVVGGTCKKCLVKGCKSCDGNVRRCTACEQDDDCYEAVEFDPRTGKCITVVESYC